LYIVLCATHVVNKHVLFLELLHSRPVTKSKPLGVGLMWQYIFYMPDDLHATEPYSVKAQQDINKKLEKQQCTSLTP